jgi:hypothetical protein
MLVERQALIPEVSTGLLTRVFLAALVVAALSGASVFAGGAATASAASTAAEANTELSGDGVVANTVNGNEVTSNLWILRENGHMSQNNYNRATQFVTSSFFVGVGITQIINSLSSQYPNNIHLQRGTTALGGVLVTIGGVYIL